VFSEELSKNSGEALADITPEFIDKFVKEVDSKLTNNSLSKKIGELESKLSGLISSV